MYTNNYANQKRAVIYVRVSTKAQVDKGSLSTQEKICREYALKNNYEVVETFIEEGESAKTQDRTELKRLLTFCTDRKNAIEIVIFYKIDRFSRYNEDYHHCRGLLRRYGVIIKSSSEFFDDSPAGRFMENTIASVAQFDNDVRAERSVGGMKEAMRNGRYAWAAPVGYDNIKIGDKGTIAPNKIMAPLVLMAFEKVAQNACPIMDTYKTMTRAGLVNKNGKPFAQSYFYSIFTNKVYTGWIIKFGEKHKGTFEPLVSEELFEQVQRVLKFKGTKHQQHITDHPDFPLRRFVHNPEGKKLTGSWSKGRSKKYPFYRLGHNGQNLKKDDFEISFKKEMDKYAFKDWQVKFLLKSLRKEYKAMSLEKNKELEQIKKYTNELKERQSALIKKNLDGVIPDSVLSQQLEFIEKELLNINAVLYDNPMKEEEIEEAIVFAKEYMETPSKTWTESKIARQIKLQWFQFPQGLSFNGKNFGTAELSPFFQLKNEIPKHNSSKVSFGFEFWNRFAKECKYLLKILKENGEVNNED